MFLGIAKKPKVTKRIPHSAATCAVRRVCGLLHGRGTGIYRTGVHFVHIVDIQQKHPCDWIGVRTAAYHHHRIANTDFDVKSTRAHFFPVRLNGAKSAFRKLDQPVDVFDREIWCYGMKTFTWCQMSAPDLVYSSVQIPTYGLGRRVLFSARHAPKPKSRARTGNATAPM
jgi:hypothetical protein